MFVTPEKIVYHPLYKKARQKAKKADKGNTFISFSTDS